MKEAMSIKFMSLIILAVMITPVLADGALITWGIEEQKTLDEKSKLTVRPDGTAQVSGMIVTCQGQPMPYSFSIVGDKIFYDWTGVEKIQCPKKLDNGSYETRTFEWHSVHMEVWEGKADNIKDTHETMITHQIKPTREFSDTSSLIKPGDKLNLRIAFTFIEEGHG